MDQGCLTPQSSRKEVSSGGKMSSSLKERLKKCGRYHGGSPLTGRRSPLHKETETQKNTIMNSSNGTDISNISREVLTEPSQMDEKTQLSVELNQREDLSEKLGVKDIQIKKECSSNSSFEVENSVAVNKFLKNIKPRNKLFHKDNSKEISDIKSLGTTSTDIGTFKQLLENKSTLQQQLEIREEHLRKLNMVKMYREKNNLSELEGLISKWKEVTQTALTDLLELTPLPRPSMTEMLQHLQVNPQFVGYNEEDDGFV